MLKSDLEVKVVFKKGRRRRSPEITKNMLLRIVKLERPKSVVE